MVTGQGKLLSTELSVGVVSCWLGDGMCWNDGFKVLMTRAGGPQAQPNVLG